MKIRQVAAPQGLRTNAIVSLYDMSRGWRRLRIGVALFEAVCQMLRHALRLTTAAD